MQHAGDGATHVAAVNDVSSLPLIDDPEAFVRARLLEAVAVLRRLPSPDDPTLREIHGLLRALADQTPSARPTAAEIERLDVVLPWLLAIPTLGQRWAALLRATPLGWHRVGRAMGISSNTAQRWEGLAIAAIVRTIWERAPLAVRLAPYSAASRTLSRGG